MTNLLVGGAAALLLEGDPHKSESQVLKDEERVSQQEEKLNPILLTFSKCLFS